MTEALAASLIVPTRNRAELLSRLLPSWAEQETEESYELIIADNGSTDDTPSVVREAAKRWPHLRLVFEMNPGGARARHTGALAARSPLLIFIDDDMRADSRLVAEHVQAHRETPRVVIVGNIISEPGSHPFERMMAYVYDGPKQTLNEREPGVHDYWSGNASMPRELYLQLGGYSSELAELRCGEDMEFGLRLKAAGLKIRFAPKAVTHHLLSERFPARLNRAHRVGVAWAHLKAAYPDLQIEIARAVQGPRQARVTELFCRMVARVVEPFARGEGRPPKVLAFVYDLGLQTAVSRGMLDYANGRSPLSRKLKQTAGAGKTVDAAMAG